MQDHTTEYKEVSKEASQDLTEMETRFGTPVETEVAREDLRWNEEYLTSKQELQFTGCGSAF